MHKVFHAQNRVSGGVVGLGYGRLYNYEAISDVNFMPTDWAIPTLTEYEILEATLTQLTGGGKIKVINTDYWDSPNTGANNSSGFSSVGSGTRSILGDYLSELQFSRYWTITEDLSINAWVFGAGFNTEELQVLSGTKIGGFSVRALYSGTGTPKTLTDYDGNIYDVVQIGTQYWTVQNWKCTHLNNGTLIPNVTDNTAWSNLTTIGRCAYNNDENNV